MLYGVKGSIRFDGAEHVAKVSVRYSPHHGSVVEKTFSAKALDPREARRAVWASFHSWIVAEEME